MKWKYLNILISVLTGGFFLWLAVKNVDFPELWQQMKTVTYYWVPFFAGAMAFSHYLRAERWRLLMPDEDFQKINRTTLFAGVMFGYVVNNLVPRLGELTRPVYVAKKGEVSSGNLVGTIVAERLFDFITLLVLIFLTVLLFLGDPEQLQQIFGTGHWQWYHYAVLPLVLAGLFTAIMVFRKTMIRIDRRADIKSPVLTRLVKGGKSFGDGMISLKNVQNWPLFLLLTAGIWTGYIIMTYLPFFMMNMQEAFGLSIADAVVLTIVSTVGVSIPAPAAIGSYHLFMQQGMWLLYDIPLTTALTYATVVHACTVFFVFVTGLAALWWDKYHTLYAPPKR